MHDQKGTLYLLPMPLGPQWKGHIPEYALGLMKQLNLFLTENARTARRFMTQFRDVHTASYDEFHKKSSSQELDRYIHYLLEGRDMGYVSEAGLPCIADPGARLVRKAHKQGVKVVPTAGNSALIMALIASGLEGQKFRFNGYLPRQDHSRAKALKALEHSARKNKQTELFMETPYRNEKMIDSIIQVLHPDTLCCIAAHITQPNAYIRTARIQEWPSLDRPNLHKVPAVFCIGSL